MKKSTLVLSIISGIVIGVILACLLRDVDVVLFLAAAVLVGCVPPILARYFTRSLLRGLLNSCRDYLEYGTTCHRTQPEEYPPEYVRLFDAPTAELIQGGMIAVGDFEAPEESPGRWCDRSFRRTFRTPDGMIWADVKYIRPRRMMRAILTLGGFRAYYQQPVLEIEIVFEDGFALSILNTKQASKPGAIPGIQLEWYPRTSPAELLRIARERKTQLETERSIPARALDLETYEEFTCIGILYSFHYAFKYFSPPDAQLRRDNFSNGAIARYHAIIDRKPFPFPPAPPATAPATVPTDGTVPQTESSTAAAITQAAETAEPPLEVAATETSAAIPSEHAPETAAAPSPEVERLLKQHQSSVTNLGIVILLSLVNVVLLVTDADVSFPFSAIFPTLTVMCGQELTLETGYAGFETAGTFLALGSILIYGICWLTARKYRGWILVALLLFLFDSLLLLPFIPGSGSAIWIDVVFHCWVLWSLFNGVRAWIKLRRIEKENIL